METDPQAIVSESARYDAHLELRHYIARHGIWPMIAVAGLDPSMSVERLRADLAIADRARRIRSHGDPIEVHEASDPIALLSAILDGGGV